MREELNCLAERLRRAYRIEAMILFGSMAQGSLHEGSDIDLIVVGDIPGRLFDRIDTVLAMTDLPVEPMVYTPEEWKQLIEEGNSFAHRVIREGEEL